MAMISSAEMRLLRVTVQARLSRKVYDAYYPSERWRALYPAIKHNRVVQILHSPFSRNASSPCKAKWSVRRSRKRS
jgi:hypothetical protein